MKKILVLLIALAILFPAIISAQEDGASNGDKAVNDIFGISLGFVAGYNLDSGDMVLGRDFSLNFTVLDSLEIGFRSISGLLAADASLFNFGYYIIPRLCIDLMVGSSGANLAAGLDVSYSFMVSSEGDVFKSALKMFAGYLFEDAAGIDSGTVMVGVSGSIGY